MGTKYSTSSIRQYRFYDLAIIIRLAVSVSRFSFRLLKLKPIQSRCFRPVEPFRCANDLPFLLFIRYYDFNGLGVVDSLIHDNPTTTSGMIA